MNDKELIQALRPMVLRDKFQCLGCGHEHQCSTHGCAILKQVLERLDQLTAPAPNAPLTLEELREVSEDNPILVWVVCVDDGTMDDDGEWQIFDGYCFINRSTENYLENYGTKFVAYRRKPEAAL